MNIPYLSRYEILKTLGQGGMGVVYLGRQKKLERLVAIKAISPYLAQEPEVRQRFAAEASALARLSHPHIVTLYDYIEEPDALYLVMEYVEGQPLSELIKAGPLPLESIKKYFLEILDAFQYAHEKGIIHRDIKPANIMITPQGHVKILDFGVARILTTDHSATRTGMRLGTLLYMSPEQVRGEREIDHRSDIYSLGLVLFEMLIGRPPYEPSLSEFDLSIKIVQEPLFDLSHPPAIKPAKLLDIVLKATEKNPDYRYPDCQSFREAFLAALEETERVVTPPTQVVNVPKASLPSKKLWPWVGVGLALLALLGGSFWWWRARITRQSPPSEASMADSLPAAKAVDSLLSPSQAEKPASPPKRDSVAIRPPSPKPPKPKPAAPPPPKPDTTAQSTPPKASAPEPSISFSEALQAEIQGFRRQGILQVKGLLIVTNLSQKPWKEVQLGVHLLNKEGQVKKSERLTIPLLGAQERWEKELSYRVGGTYGMRAEILSAKEP